MLQLVTPVGVLDAVIFSECYKRALAIVECKRNDYGKVFFSKQIKRYKTLGIPVYGLARIERAAGLAAQLLRTYSITDPNVGRDFEDILRSQPKIKRRRFYRSPEMEHKWSPMHLCEEINYKD